MAWTCKGCSAVWASTALLHCTQCHEFFGGEESFTSHRQIHQCWYNHLIQGPNGVHYSPDEWWSAEKMEKVRRGKLALAEWRKLAQEAELEKDTNDLST